MDRFPSTARRSLSLCTLAASLALCTPAVARERVGIDDLAKLSLEELGNLRITSVSKRPERLAEAAASVFVITSDDILRSGATSLPEVLRLAPNLQVAQVSSGGYAISARGMNGSVASAPNKLLVMIDGRSVYSPLFSGVFWDAQELMLSDVERIEVISGPGSTLWGVNAVNGVINVITREASRTQGVLVAATAGENRSVLGARTGGRFGEDGAWRVYARAASWRHGWTAAGEPVNDAGHSAQAGFRMDWGDDQDRFSVQGNLIEQQSGQPRPGALQISGLVLPLGDIESSGANLSASWVRPLQGGGQLSLQAYYDHTERSLPPMFAEKLDLYDIQLQHALAPRGRHALTWGANHRVGLDSISNGPYLAFLPADLAMHWTSLFVQDEISLSDQFDLTVGVRAERNDVSGWEWLPNARLAWSPSSRHLWWLSASRAVRAPSRLDSDVFYPAVPPFLLRGGPEVRSELADVVELGYRGQAGDSLSWSAALFHSRYDRLRTQEIDPGFTFLTFANGLKGTVTGAEAWGRYQATPSLILRGGFTALRVRQELIPGSNDLAAPLAAGNDPTHTWQAGASWDLSAAHRLDLDLRHVGALEAQDAPDYTVLDLRFGWTLSPQLGLTLAGRNLLGRHVEYGMPEFRAVIEPEWSLSLRWEPQAGP